MVGTVDVDVVDVDEELAIGLGQHRVDEGRFVELVGQTEIVRRVLDRDAALKPVLYFADARRDMVHSLFGERDGQQFIELAAGRAK